MGNEINEIKSPNKKFEPVSVNFFTSKSVNISEGLELLKISFTPIELLVLKIFFRNPSPKTTRDLQKLIIETVFYSSFRIEGSESFEGNSEEQSLLNELWNRLYNFMPNSIKNSINPLYDLNFWTLNKQLLESGYSSKNWKGLVTSGDFQGLNDSKKLLEKQKIIKKNGIKIPSFDFLKMTIEGLTELGFFSKREMQRNIVFYILNPEFYSIFKKNKVDLLLL